MLRYVPDLANLTTLLGLLVSTAALVLAAKGRPAVGLALALLAIAIDNVDGALARRDPGRSEEMRSFGAHLDCFADFVSKGLFPALLLITVAGAGPFPIVVAGLHVCAIAVRYSYEFVPRAPAIGLSPDYSLLVFASWWLAAEALGGPTGVGLALLMLAMAGLNVAPVRVPKLGGAGRVVFFAGLALLFGLLLLAR